MKTPDLRPIAGNARRLAVLSAAMLVAAGPAAANPKGGQVVAGSATISSPSTTQLNVNQSTDRAAINWMSFNIAPNEQTSFHQPSSTSMTLNRVQAGDPSIIAGRLSANGQIVLVNPSGIVFSKGSQVDVNALIATPIDISNGNFMAGRMKFDKPPTDPRATVVNNGKITVAQKGFAALVAPGVANAGVIQAKLGKVVLAGAETFTVDFYGDGLINFDVGSKVTAAPRGADGKPLKSLVSNSGEIIAQGGTVLLTADAAAGIVENVVDVPGQITARSAGQQAAKVTIDAGIGNTANLSGKIDVSGLGPGQVGGAATVTGGAVQVASGARIDARGTAGGGTVKLGGGPHGKDQGVRNARTTTVAAGAVIDASATGRGNGGQVTVWADDTTVFNGSILARGGPKGGDGGWVETSGAGLVVAGAALVDAGAPRGMAGTWLLDPKDIFVVPDEGFATIEDVNRFDTKAGTTQLIDGFTIVRALNTANVDLKAGNNIILDAAVNSSGNADTHNLTLLAGNRIEIHDNIKLKGSFSATANDSTDTQIAGDPIAAADRNPGDGSFVMDAGKSLDVSTAAAQAISITIGPAATNTHGGANYVPGQVTLGKVATGPSGNLIVGGDATSINQTLDGLTVGGTSSFGTGAAAATIVLQTATNALTREVMLKTTGAAGNASLTDGVALTVNGAVGGLATLNAPAIQFDTFTAGSLLATATTGGISQTDGVLTVTGISSLTDTTANQTILLNTATNALGGAITLTTAGTTGDVNIKNSGGTTLAASTVNGKLTVEDTTGGIAQTGALTVTGASSFTTDAADQTIALSTPANALTGEVTLNTTGAAGNASLTDGVALTVNGAVGGLATLNAPAIQFDTFTAGSLLATATTGGISQTDGVLTVTGISSLTDTTANQTILLNTATNALGGAITLTTAGTTGDVNIKNSGGTTLAASTVNGKLTVEDTTGGIAQTGALTVTGASSFTTDAADQTIALSTPANALTGEVTLNTTGAAGNASLTDGVALTVNGAVGGLATLNAPAIQFDTFTAGSLLATATTGGISQTDGVLTVTGILSLTDTTANQTILLNTATNALGGAITLTTAGTTGDVNIKNSGGTTLAASTVNGKLTVEDTTGGIAQTGALTVTGASSFTTDAADQTIALSTPANALTGEVTLNTTGAAGNASLTDGVALTVNGAVGGLATLNAPAIQFDTFAAGSLLATATTGGISQTDGVLTVTGILVADRHDGEPDDPAEHRDKRARRRDHADDGGYDRRRQY